jgi:hypothetical protein
VDGDAFVPEAKAQEVDAPFLRRAEAPSSQRIDEGNRVPLVTMVSFGPTGFRILEKQIPKVRRLVFLRQRQKPPDLVPAFIEERLRLGLDVVHVQDWHPGSRFDGDAE